MPTGNNRRRILYFIPSLRGGGAERQVAEHLARLPRHHFRLDLALCHGDGIYLERLPPDVDVRVLPAGEGWAAPRRVRHLRRLLRKRRYDALVSHIWYCDFLSLLADLTTPQKVPRICFVHSDYRRLLGDLGSTILWRNRIALHLTQRLYRRAHRVVFLTEATRREICRRTGLPEERTTVIPNGVDPARLRALARDGEPLPWPGSGLRIVAVGRLAPEKGYDLLLEALARIRDRGLEASLLILGEGPERSRLERMIEGMRLGNRASLPGFVRNPFPTIRHAEMAVLSSRWEGLPNAILEAMALGTPVLSADCPSGPRTLREEGAGVLVPPDDVEGLAEGLARLIQSVEERSRLSRRGLMRVRDYDWRVIVPRLKELLRSVPCREAPSRPDTPPPNPPG